VLLDPRVSSTIATIPIISTIAAIAPMPIATRPRFGPADTGVV
jgi:hypothetical protein